MANEKGGVIKKIEKSLVLLRVPIVLVSAYLIYRKYKSEVGLQLPPEITGARESAMTPLVTPTAQALTGQPAQNIAYQGASPDQMNTTRQLATSEVRPLTPSALTTAAITTGGKELLTSQGMEDQKASDVARKAGDIYQAFLPS